MANAYDINGNLIDGGGSGGTYIDYDSIMKAVNHRGYNTDAPENTIPAFKMSRRKGFNYVETDVRFTSDGVAVLIHDATINRTARNADGTSVGSQEIYVNQKTYAELLEYDFGIWKSQDWAGTKIPRFDDFITLCKNIGLKPYIELKAGTEAQIQGLVDTVKNNGIFDSTTWISNNSTLLGYVTTYDDTATIGYLSSIDSSGVATAQTLRTGNNYVFLNGENRGTYDVSVCKNANMPLEVWTVNTSNLITALDHYITGVTSDSLNVGKVLYNANIN